MQEEIFSLSKQLASYQRNQYDLEKQLMMRNQKLIEKESEIEHLNAKVEKLQA